MNFSDVSNKPWQGARGELADFIRQKVDKRLSAYKNVPSDVREHANTEHDAAYGGYADRQLFELVQNSTDSLFDSSGERIHICLQKDFLYCADNGSPVDKEGIEALISAHLGNKRRRSGMIGRFGLGFKSVLGVSDSPEFYSRSVSFRFDRKHAEELIGKVVSGADRYPVLRTPQPIDPAKQADKDKQLQELMKWATNIVRLPLKDGKYEALSEQIWKFPPEFLLMVDHVRWLHMKDEESDREFELQKDDDGVHRIIDSGERFEEKTAADSKEKITRWKLFKKQHSLSDAAKEDYKDNKGNKIEIRWAARLDRADPGKFWAFFPTNTVSLVPGVLNTHWKTNEDRQNLLSGIYNDELIGVAAELIATSLPKFAIKDDPARHLDMLPRRQDTGDSEQSITLRKDLLTSLSGKVIVPDQDGNLRTPSEVFYPPKLLTDGQHNKELECWASYSGRPSNWLHHRAFTRKRMAVIDWLVDSNMERRTISEWLEVLVRGRQGDDLVQASMVAIKVAAMLQTDESLGGIVLTAAGNLLPPDHESLVLPGPGETLDDDGAKSASVHPQLAADADTFDALEKLGVKPPSPESRFKSIYARILETGGKQNSLWKDFWKASRKLPEPIFANVLKLEIEVLVKVRRPDHPAVMEMVQTLAGEWKPLHRVLLPGEIVPSDGSRDDKATVDMNFHKPDHEVLLKAFRAAQSPHDDRKYTVSEEYEDDFYSFRRSRVEEYLKQDNLRTKPKSEKKLDFDKSRINHVGPLSVFEYLSDEGKALYTDALLKIDAVFERWIMHHTSQSHYPEMSCESFAMYILRKHGRIRTGSGIVVLADVLDEQPANKEVLRWLLKHSNAAKIKKAFKLAGPTPEFHGKGDPEPLTDIWPGLKKHLPESLGECCLVRCERIVAAGETEECVYRAPDIYLADSVEEDRQLKLVADRLEGLDLEPRQIEAIQKRTTSQDVEERRAAICSCQTDAERLLKAVGEETLRAGLPNSLLDMLKHERKELSGADIAEATIATWHTGALKRYKSALDHLDPPGQWAGSARAVEFVKSLGFSDAWAGEPNRKRAPFLEVEGPHSLPPLHDYQEAVSKNIREMLRDGNGADRRGLVSMPTGSGKTRVAVQAIVEAIRDGQLQGGVLWVADRDELCEQAVEAWRQVWASVGAEAERLRISRMWDGSESPLPRSELHVIVATIQTLSSKFASHASEYRFLAKEFKLIVFDEAHRSIAPTFTSVMEEIGLTRYKRENEPFLLGLTATPYRGHDETETARLVSRYGNRRLDKGAFANDDSKGVIHELQGRGVLAYADHEKITGETLSMDQAELEKMRAPRGDGYLPWLPKSVEMRIASSVDRTKRIIEAYENHIQPKDWPALVFATSVEHSQTVAALLNRKGIKARSVSGYTERAVRRRVVEEFRCGEIRALVNYGVFREGFDAPKTRAIIVARPVYSPNLYFQMIGRGLRGPSNGGDDRCLILNVSDNIENFQGSLAFTELDWLWVRDSDR